MESEALIKLSEKFESLARRWPRLTAFRVMLWLCFGSAAVPALIVLMVATLALLTYVSIHEPWLTPAFAIISILPLYLLYFAIRSLFLRSSTPGGLPLDPNSAGTLWPTVNSLSKSVAARPPHELLIVESLSASMVSLPRWGVLGNFKGHLILGLPLLIALPESEVKTVIAHELAHHSKRHAFLLRWCNRVVATWSIFGSALNNLAPTGRKTPFLLQGHVRLQQFFFPRLLARTHVYFRRHEHEADRIAAQHCGRESSTLALCRLHLAFRQWDDFWDTLDRRGLTESKPPATPIDDLAAFFAKPLDRQTALDTLRQSLSIRTEYWSTHPCLLDRINATGFLKDWGIALEDARNNPLPLATLLRDKLLPLDTPPEPPAAQSLLGPDFDPVVTKVESYIRQSLADRWKTRHLQLKEHQSRIQAAELLKSTPQTLPPPLPPIPSPENSTENSLNTTSPETPPPESTSPDSPSPILASTTPLQPPPLGPVESELELALSLEQVRGPDDALQHLHLLQQAHPTHPEVLYNLGRILIYHKKSDDGISPLEAALATDMRSRDTGLNLLYRHYTTTNRHELAKQILIRIDEHENEMKSVQFHLSHINTTDEFLPHELSETNLNLILNILKSHKRISHAWLGRKRIAYRPDLNSLTLVIHYNVPTLLPSPSTKTLNKLAATIARDTDKIVPLTLYVLCPANSDTSDRILLAKFHKSPHLLVFQR